MVISLFSGFLLPCSLSTGNPAHQLHRQGEATTFEPAGFVKLDDGKTEKVKSRGLSGAPFCGLGRADSPAASAFGWKE
jgi:hypothetical protein